MKKKQKKLKTSDKIRKVNGANPETGIIAEAGHIIRHGGVVVFPTRSLYGIGVDAFNDRAVNRIFHIKKRIYWLEQIRLTNFFGSTTVYGIYVDYWVKKKKKSYWSNSKIKVFEKNRRNPHGKTISKIIFNREPEKKKKVKTKKKKK